MKKIQDLISGEKFWVPDRGIITKNNDDSYTGIDGTFGPDSILNIHGKFQYFSPAWWDLNAKFFDVTKFKKGLHIFTISGLCEKIHDIKRTEQGMGLYNQNKMFDYIPNTIVNNTWFTNIVNLKGNVKIGLHRYLKINFDRLPKEFIDNNPDIIEFADEVMNFKSKKHNQTLLGE